MATQGQQAAAMWQDADFARAWSAGDTMADILDFPRRLAAAIVALDQPPPATIIDIGSGPGAFLEAFLREFPDARGIWSDTSEAMGEQARERLAPFGGRVEFITAEMTELRAAGLPGAAGVVMTSRAAHHLDRAELAAFYTEAAAHLAPGGWLINLDHTGPTDAWDKRFRAVRPRFTGPRNKEAKHHHNYPLTSIQDHMDGYAAAGITDVDFAWKTFFTVLLMGRKEAVS